MISDDISRIMGELGELLDETDPDRSGGYVDVPGGVHRMRELMGLAYSNLREARIYAEDGENG